MTVERTRGLPESWDEEADLVVLGTGGAGLAGALVGAAEGASVIVLEKSDLVGGTTATSGGGMWVPVNDHSAEVGVEDSREEALEYLRASTAGGGTEEGHIERFVDVAAEMARYLEDRGGLTFRAYPPCAGGLDYRAWLPGAKSGGRSLDSSFQEVTRLGEWADRLRNKGTYVGDKFDGYRAGIHALSPDEAKNIPRSPGPPGDPEHYVANGAGLICQLLHGCLEHGVTVYVETPAEQLLVAEGRVVGVRARRGGRDLFVRARGGVLVATGGFAHNEELKRLWLTRPLDYSCEVEECQGDGHLMGLAIGAQLANLEAWWAPFVKDPRRAVAGSTRDARVLPRSMIVNKRGRRFMNEVTNYYDAGEPLGSKQDGPQNLPAWILFDDAAREKYSALAARIPPGPEEGWPDWIARADTLEELAARLGIDAEGLVATVEEFNRNAREGKDPHFGRGQNPFDLAWGDPGNEPNASLGPVEVGPFWAVEVFAGALATKGGLRVNLNGEVLSALSGEPIPGLYAAGNCSSSGIPFVYGGAGSTLGTGMAFAYLAAKRVAAAVREAVPAA